MLEGGFGAYLAVLSWIVTPCILRWMHLLGTQTKAALPGLTYRDHPKNRVMKCFCVNGITFIFQVLSTSTSPYSGRYQDLLRIYVHRHPVNDIRVAVQV
jgi:hypothetical protein